MTDSKDTTTQALPTPSAGPRMLHVPVTSIARSLTNPRKTFDPAKLQELADSIAASGVHQPILLRPLPASRLEDTLRDARAQKQPAPEYELVAGERRWRACQLANVVEVPAMIRPMTDAQALEAQVIENLQREDVTELEEAEGYQILMETVGINADEVGQRISKSRSYVYARLKILELCEAGRQALREGKLDFSSGLYIARIPNELLQIKALEWAMQTTHLGERMSARTVQDHVRRNFMLDLEHAKFDREDANLCPSAGSCKACPKRTGANPDMFADVKSADVCTNPPCYHAKEDAHAFQLRERSQAMGAEIITGREAKALIPSAYSGSIDGFVRLDVAADSPIKGKPLRTVVSKAMEQAGIVPTLIENPHAKNELIAVVRTEQAAELLKMAGKADAEAQLREEAKHDEQAKARQDAKDTAEKIARDWRATLAARTIQLFCNGEPGNDADHAGEQAVTQYVIGTLNKETATRLCKIFGLGTVAPIDALRDYAAEHKVPMSIATSVLLLRDSEYMPWLETVPQAKPANALLLKMAELCKVDASAVQAEVQANHRATKATDSATKPAAPNADLPLTPAAHTHKGAGGGKAKGKNQQGPAALASGGGKKLTADAAAASIAAALQALPGEPELGAAAAAQSNIAEPVAADAAQALPPSVKLKASKLAMPSATTPAAAGTGESVNDGPDRADTNTGAATKKALTPEELLANRVIVLPSATGKGQKIYIGDEGTVVAIIGPEAVDVSFPGPKGCKPVRIGFHVTELELV